MRHRRAAAIMGGIVAATLLAGCESRSVPHTAGAAPTSGWPGVVVDVDWLRDRMGSPGLVVLDARAPDAYAAGHIPCAANVARRLTERPRSDGVSNLIPVPEMEALLGRAGVAQDTPVIVYDDGGHRDAARLFWVLEVHGHSRAAVLSGGLEAWRRRGLELSSDTPAPAPRRFIANLQPDRLANKLQVMRAVQGLDAAVILDARSQAEYRGEQSNSGRAGHIPSARNVAATSNLEVVNEAACLVDDLSTLRKLYADLPSGGRVLTYCNSGTRASLSYLALRLIGRDVAVYDGSWQEWSSDPSLPIETGP